MPTGQLRGEGWAKLNQDYPDPNVITAVLGIYTFSARIGYEGYRNTSTIHPNLKTAIAEAPTVSANILLELNKSCLEVFPDLNRLPSHFTASPLGLTDKADGSNRRIHHLSYPPGDMSWINDGIPEHYGTIQYNGIEDAIQAVQPFGRNSILIKRDFKSAFHHIPVLPKTLHSLGSKGRTHFMQNISCHSDCVRLYICSTSLRRFSTGFSNSNSKRRISVLR